MSVNRPTNVKQKEADVNQKLQLYGIYSGMCRIAINGPCRVYHTLCWRGGKLRWCDLIGRTGLT